MKMMALNKEVVDKCYTFLRPLLLRGNEIVEGFQKFDFVPCWDEPKVRRVLDEVRLRASRFANSTLAKFLNFSGTRRVVDS